MRNAPTNGMTRASHSYATTGANECPRIQFLPVCCAVGFWVLKRNKKEVSRSETTYKEIPNNFKKSLAIR